MKSQMLVIGSLALGLSGLAFAVGVPRVRMSGDPFVEAVSEETPSGWKSCTVDCSLYDPSLPKISIGSCPEGTFCCGWANC